MALVALAPIGPAGCTDAPPPPVDDPHEAELDERVDPEVIERIDARGRARVVIELAYDEPPAEPGHEVDELVRKGVAAAQQPVLEKLHDTAIDLSMVTAFRYVPGVVATVDAEQLAVILEVPAVTRVRLEALAAPTLSESVPLVRAPQVWARGFEGTGLSIAIIDTGVDSDHPALAGRIHDAACFSTENAEEEVFTACPDGSTEQIGVGAAPPCRASWIPGPVTGCDHGTLVATIAAGGIPTPGGVSGPRGVAPQVGIIPVLSGALFDDEEECGRNGRSTPCVLIPIGEEIRSLEHIFELSRTQTIAAVNLSFGAGYYVDEASCVADTALERSIIRRLEAVGVATVASAGNSAGMYGIGAPACIPEVVSVGSTDKKSLPDTAATFSSDAGPLVDVLAPGERIEVATSNGGKKNASGTSMSAPHVTGGFALLLQQTPGSSVADRLDFLKSTGAPIFNRWNGLTKPLIQLDGAGVFGGQSACFGDPPAPLPTAEGVYVYEDTEFRGRCVRLFEDFGDARRWSFGDDNVSSIRVVGPFTASVFDERFFLGTSQAIALPIGPTRDLKFLDDVLGNDRISSIRIRRVVPPLACDGTPGVYLFSDANFEGDCTRVTGDVPDLRTLAVGDDRISSIRIQGDFTTVVFRDGWYAPTVTSAIANDVANLETTDVGNDAVSSLRVFSAANGLPCNGDPGVYLFSEEDFEGDCRRFVGDGPDARTWVGFGNDNAESIRFVGKWDARLYPDILWNGAAWKYSGDDPDLDDEGGDQVSSIRVKPI